MHPAHPKFPEAQPYGADHSPSTSTASPPYNKIHHPEEKGTSSPTHPFPEPQIANNGAPSTAALNPANAGTQPLTATDVTVLNKWIADCTVGGKVDKRLCFKTIPWRQLRQCSFVIQYAIDIHLIKIV